MNFINDQRSLVESEKRLRIFHRQPPFFRILKVDVVIFRQNMTHERSLATLPRTEYGYDRMCLNRIKEK